MLPGFTQVWKSKLNYFNRLEYVFYILFISSYFFFKFENIVNVVSPSTAKIFFNLFGTSCEFYVLVFSECRVCRETRWTTWCLRRESLGHTPTENCSSPPLPPYLPRAALRWGTTHSGTMSEKMAGGKPFFLLATTTRTSLWTAFSRNPISVLLHRIPSKNASNVPPFFLFRNFWIFFRNYILLWITRVSLVMNMMKVQWILCT